MSTEQDVTRIVRSWLEDGADALPDRVLDRVLDELPATPQRRAAWHAWRLNTMSSPIKITLAAAAVGLFALGGITLLPKTSSGPGNAGPGPTASPEPPSPEPSAPAGSPTPRPPFFNPGCGACLGYITAGTYTSAQFTVPTTFTVPAEWTNYGDTSDYLLLNPPGQTGEDYIGVFWNIFALSQDCLGTRDHGVGQTAKELADWMARLPGLKTGGAQPVSIGGLDGFYVDISVDPTWTRTCQWDLTKPSVDLIGGNWGMYHAITANGQARYYFLDAGTHPIAIEVQYTPRSRTFDEYLAWVSPVIESMQFQLP